MKKVVLLLTVLAFALSAQVKVNRQNVAEKPVVNDTPQVENKLEFYPTMGYQGLLKDNNGKFVTDGDYTVSFNIYDSEDGETAIWEESQEVTITGGVINCYIGAVEKLNLPFDRQYWLSVSVGNDELPRMIMAGTPYSLHARRIAEDAIIGGKNISVSKDGDGKLVLSGEAGGKTATDNLFDGSNYGIYQIDCSSSTGNHAVALGNGSTASGDSSSVSIGNSCTSSARTAVSLGGWNHATGIYSVAIGTKNSTSGSSNSIAIGRLNTVTDYHSVAIGSSNTVDSLYSYALGYGCNNNRRYTFSIGSGVVNDAPKSIKMSTYSSGAMLNIGQRFITIGLNDAKVDSMNNKWSVSTDPDYNSDWYADHPKNSLFVAETIFAKALELKTDVWADYVFEDNYRLTPLGELESFIKNNKHLPGIIKEKDALNNGVNVGDIQVKLLEKIEELTLYIIEQDSKIQELEKKIR